MDGTADNGLAHHAKGAEHDNSDTHAHKSGGSYLRFVSMVGTSTAIMFGLMYLNTYAFEHVFWSETRFYMTFVMGAVMAVVMLLFMWGMYRNKAANAAILAGSALLFAVALWLVRSQETVQDESWMSAMIPHHSIAIMTSKRAEISDPRMSALARDIVHAQNREIAEMRFLLADIEARGEAGTDWPLGETEGPAPVASHSEAISTPVVAAIRPAPMSSEEISRAFGGDAVCTFAYAVDADPVLATNGKGKGIAKISGALVPFEADGSIAEGGVLNADGGWMTVLPGEDAEDATLLFELSGDTALALGWVGHWKCSG